ncbi:MAG: hypothetical protein Q4G35_06035 [Propionibacteriaceae bacterium]|nr:hypothetical protein [Propionibacteriaceae bacterium]
MSLSISTSALGAWRGATTLFGPLNTLITLLDFAILGRYVALEQGERYRYLRRLGLAYAGIAAGWGLLLALVPDTVGGLLLGPSWPDATRLLPIAAVEYVFLCAVAVVLLEFKASQWARRITINKLLTSGIIVGVSLTVALTLPSIEFIALASVAGAVAGFALAVSAVLTTSRRP